MRKIIWIISAVLMVVPFFWFGPEVINIGGDSSRLYFYDPFAFLKHFSLYSVIPSESGFEIIPYYFIPFSLFLGVIKWFVGTPHLLITIFYSFMLVTSFSSVTFILQELLKQKDDLKKGNRWKILAAIFGGLFYAIAPIIGPNWDKNLISHNQIFLNPLIFYLLLRFISTNKMLYGYCIVLVTLIFAPGFSFSSAPAFFSFYPLAILFLAMYVFFF